MAGGFGAIFRAMPSCTVRYSVRLTPKAADARAIDAIGIFSEVRAPDELGMPGRLISRQLNTFSGPAGYSVRDMVTRGNDWTMDVQDRVGPLQWDS
jgi:hypothetical protein